MIGRYSEEINGRTVEQDRMYILECLSSPRLNGIALGKKISENIFSIN
jgi:hypothetical protein